MPEHFSDFVEPFTEPHYSSWDVATHGPQPRPDWVVTELAAVDAELGLLKTGKEADVHLVSRTAPDGRQALMAAKRYRAAEHRMFHRDAGYTEGRRVRRSRETRAMARRTEFGREQLAGRWAIAEFEALGRLWEQGAAVPYPVQLSGTELMLEFLGTDDGRPAPRLVQLRPTAAELAELFDQCVDAMRILAGLGYAHGDLSPYNVLVHEGRLVLIDLPQVVDLFANPRGMEFLERDCRNICRWFAARGLEAGEFEHLFGDLTAEAVARW
ncbi:MAG TPA: RIO1 family regulatory kinase/ATPase [Jatrophihabitans sp.]|nr:RIO1 family regulatory kinase/ATPase [Jatrophihabitans sp.]